MPAKAPLHPWEWPSEPWHRVEVDYADFNGQSLLIIINTHSKWIDVHVTRGTTSAVTIEKLRRCFATYGLPHVLVSDNGPCFASADFAEFAKRNGIRHKLVSPHHKASNGLAERSVGVVKTVLGKLDEGALDTKLSRFLLSYRTTPQSTTGVTPAELLMRRHLRTNFDRLKPSVVSTVFTSQANQKRSHDNTAQSLELNTGDPVFVRI